MENEKENENSSPLDALVEKRIQETYERIEDLKKRANDHLLEHMTLPLTGELELLTEEITLFNGLASASSMFVQSQAEQDKEDILRLSQYIREDKRDEFMTKLQQSYSVCEKNSFFIGRISLFGDYFGGKSVREIFVNLLENMQSDEAKVLFDMESAIRGETKRKEETLD